MEFAAHLFLSADHKGAVQSQQTHGSSTLSELCPSGCACTTCQGWIGMGEIPLCYDFKVVGDDKPRFSSVSSVSSSSLRDFCPRSVTVRVKRKAGEETPSSHGQPVPCTQIKSLELSFCTDVSSPTNKTIHRLLIVFLSADLALKWSLMSEDLTV